MIGKIVASNMHDGRWLFSRLLTEPSAENRGLGQVEIAAIRECDAHDARVTVEWLNERLLGYPKLAAATILPWPQPPQLWSWQEGATTYGRKP